MNARIGTLAGLCFFIGAVCAFTARAVEADEVLLKANWIWSARGDFLAHCRKTFSLTEDVKSAEVLITADNGYELYVNGSFLGSDIGAESAVWQSVERFDVTQLLKKGANVIAARATDLGGEAGFLCALRCELKNGQWLELVTDGSWRVTPSSDPTGYAEAGYKEDASWRAPLVIGKNGCAPWGIVSTKGPRSPNLIAGANAVRGFKEAGEGFRFPEQVIVLRGRVPESSTAGSPQAVWRIGNSRSYLELDTLGPSIPGRSINLLTREKSGEKATYNETTLFNAAGGLVGSPSISHDGKTLYFSYAPQGEKFWRIAKLNIGSGELKILGAGRFHDFDPEPLPDGRIVFSSTRIGNREEYHGNFARSIFVMNGDGTGITAITHHIVGDMEPKLTGSGNLVFVRQDNFLERAKVETHIHSVRPDGTAGQVLLGPDRGALGYSVEHAAEQNGLWLRNYGYGSPAPLPDGRVAALSSIGLVISGNEVHPQLTLRPSMELVDISALPDGRLLCTLAGNSGIGVLDPEKNDITRIYTKPPFDLHSVIYGGARQAPQIARSLVDADGDKISKPTGFLLGQSIFITRQQNADIKRVKGIRVIEGRPFAVRSAHHPYDHVGVEAIELGTVPIAPDGSFYIEVPADRALSLQAVDGEGRTVVNELSWIYVRPGEQRSCVGCHSQREAAPANSGSILALRAPAVKLLGQGRPHRFRGNNAANGGVLNLQIDRMREPASIDLHAENVSALIQMLAGSERELRISASQRLAIARDHSASPALERALSDESGEVRMNAALALATCGTRSSISQLARVTDDSEACVAQAANVAIETITGEKNDFNAFAPTPNKKAAAEWRDKLVENSDSLEKKLIARLENAGPEAEDIFNALSHAGSNEAIEKIQEFLAKKSGSDLRVELAAIRALGQLRSEKSVALLTKLLRDNSKLRNNTAGDHEFGWTQRPVQIAAASAEALGRIGTKDAANALIAAFNELADFWQYTFRTADHDWLMGCHSSPIHYRIIEALDRIEDADATPILSPLIRSIPIDPDRGLLFENDAFETVASRLIARSGKREEVVAACASVLLGKQNSSAYLATVTNSPPAVSVGPMEPESRAAQILAIVSAGHDAPILRASLEKFRREAPSRLRSWTCFYLARGLGRLQDRESAALLASILLKDPTESSLGLLAPPNVFVFEAMTPFYRAAAADALGRIGGSEASDALIKTVGNLENAVDVRNSAARALSRLARPELLGQLKELAADYPEYSTRRLLLEACERASDPAKKLAQTK